MTYTSSRILNPTKRSEGCWTTFPQDNEKISPNQEERRVLDDIIPAIEGVMSSAEIQRPRMPEVMMLEIQKQRESRFSNDSNH